MMDVKIGSLNCLNFGMGSRNKKDIGLIAKIIKNEKYDIVALQEIKPGVIEYILNSLNFGSAFRKWSGCADNDGAVNDYAFIWNTEHIMLPQTKLANGEIRVFRPHIYRQYGRDPELGKLSIARPPFYGRFQTAFPGLPKIELRLINAHIRWSKGKDGKEMAPSFSEVALRKYEFKALTKNIYYRVSDKVYGRSEGEGSPLTAYTVLLGDYNLNLKGSCAHSPYYLDELETIFIKCDRDSSRDKMIVTKQSELTTLKKQDSSEKQDTDTFSNNYDHFTYDENRFNGVRSNISRINTVEKYCNNDVQMHIEKVSDHTPIKMTLSVKKGE